MFDAKKLLKYEYFPEELPECFSSIGLATHYNELKGQADSLVTPTTPFLFSIYKSENARRRMSIPNPISYIRIVNRIVSNEIDLQAIFDKSKISLTKPSAEQKNTQKRAYNRVSNSPIETRYANEKLFSNNTICIKMDISNFFDSIYTHSVSWAIHTKDVAKTKKDDKTLLGNIIDSALQNLNDRQTHGILVGNAVSRIVSEIILCDIDSKISKKFPNIGVCRFVDDYSFYISDKESPNAIISFVRNQLLEYDLVLNEAKTKVINAPFVLEHSGIDEIKSISTKDAYTYYNRMMILFEKNKDLSLLKYGFSIINSILEKKDIEKLITLLIHSWVTFPSLAHKILPIIYRFKNDLTAQQKKELKKALLTIIHSGIELRQEVEAVWALWALTLFGFPLNEEIVRLVCNSNNDLAIIIALLYSELWTTGKAMFVCVNKVTCVRMYNLAQKYWKLKIEELERNLQTASQQENQELNRKLKWMKETEMAVVVSQEQNEIKTFQNWGLDIVPHREKMEKRELDKEFKDSNNPFRIVFVCAMWLTGFDVKSLANIYLDKPLKAHTLMQTIARANRVCDGKSNGLIIDYIGVVKALREALADYTKSKNSDIPNNPAPDKEELIKKVLNTINSIDKYMDEHGFALKSLVEATDFEKLALVAAGANAICTSTEVKQRFEIQARELFRCFKYIERKEVSAETVHYKNAISAIYEQLQEKRKHADNSALMAQLNEIVSSYVDVTKNPGDEDSRKFDISNIDFDRLRKEFEKAKNRNLMFKDLQDVVEERLARMLSNNPLRINYYERYQEIVDAYNKENKKDEIAIIFENLMNFVSELDDEQKRYVREGFDSDEELTMFDLLIKDSLSKEEIKKVKKLAQTMLAKIKAKIHELDHWRDKEETQSIISVMIRDLLWEELPDSYDDAAVSTYRNQIFEYVYNTYPAA